MNVSEYEAKTLIVVQENVIIFFQTGEYKKNSAKFIRIFFSYTIKPNLPEQSTLTRQSVLLNVRYKPK